MARYHYVFPRWSNLLLPTVLVAGAIAPLYMVLVVAYFMGWIFTGSDWPRGFASLFIGLLSAIVLFAARRQRPA